MESPELPEARLHTLTISTPPYSHRAMDLGRFPPELILNIVAHISLRDHANCLLASRHLERLLSPALYVRLPSLQAEEAGRVSYHDGVTQLITRKFVLAWAAERGCIATLRRLEEVERLDPFLNYTVFSSSPRTLYQPPILLLHLAALHGQTEVVEYLLARGADVNRRGIQEFLPLHFATTGDVIRTLVKHGSRVEAPPTTSLLVRALTLRADATAVRALIELGENPDALSPDNRLPVAVAIESGNVEALEALLQLGASPSRQLPSGGHPMYHAIWTASRRFRTSIVRKARGLFESSSGRRSVGYRMVELLLDYGASPNSGYEITPPNSDEVKVTPYFFLAVMMDDSYDIVRLLLERGADLHAPFSNTRECLDREARTIPGFEFAHSHNLVANLIGAVVQSRVPNGDGDQSVVKPDAVRKIRLLVEHGGNIDGELKGFTPLQYCLRLDIRRAENALELLPLLIELGADVHNVDKHGNQPLHNMAAFFFRQAQGRWQSARSIVNYRFKQPSPLTHPLDLLIQRGASPNARNASGQTPLMLLCGQPEQTSVSLAIRALLKHNDIRADLADESNMTALHHLLAVPVAIFDHECLYRLQLLLQRGGKINTNARDRWGRTPLHLLLGAKDPELHHGFSSSHRHWRSEKKRALTMLIRAGADTLACIEPQDSHQGVFMNELPIRNGAVRGIKRDVLGPLANVLHNGKGETHGNTPLHFACEGQDCAAMVEFMLQQGAGAHVNAVASGQRLTPLMTIVGLAAAGHSSRRDMDRVVRLLIKAGADVNLRDASGRTAWEIFQEIREESTTIWAWEPSLEAILPTMMEKERRSSLGFGATDRPRFEWASSSSSIPQTADNQPQVYMGGY